MACTVPPFWPLLSAAEAAGADELAAGFGWLSVGTAVASAPSTISTFPAATVSLACAVTLKSAAMLSALVGSRVFIGFAAPCRDGSGYPSVPDAVKWARQAGASRVAVASYLLADGVFQGRLREAGADVVAAPLGLHPAVIRLACSRCRHADVRAA